MNKSVEKRYLDGIYHWFGHRANWLPDERMSLGDVGVFERGRFYRRTSLAELKIKFSIRKGRRGDALSVTAGTELTMSAGAHVGTTGGTIRFGAAGSFVFQASGVRTDTIENMATVAQEIVYQYRGGHYDRTWIVVDRLVHAQSTTVLMASSDSAELVLSAKAPLQSFCALTDAALDISVKGAKGEITQYISRAGLTPMYGASRLSRPFLLGVRVDPMRDDKEDFALPLIEDIGTEDRLVDEDES